MTNRSGAGPHLESWRAAHGLPDADVDHDALERAGRCTRAGWLDLELAVAHLVLGFRPTCGLAAPYWTRRCVHEWLDDLADEELDARATALTQQAAEVAEEAA